MTTKLYSIETGNFKLDGGALFGVVPKTLWQKWYTPDENNLINCAMRCLLVDTGDRRILIDNGLGDKQDAKFFSYYSLNGSETLLSSLQNHGYSPESITDVVLTHLHFDHCGGTIKYNEQKKLVPTFANATCHISSKQWLLALNPNIREKPSLLKENILPIKESGKLHLIEKDVELFPGFFIKMFHGHTQGLMVPHIEVNGKLLIYAADLIPMAGHIPAQYIPAYDTDQLLAIADKDRFYAEVIDREPIIFFEHDLDVECCTIQKTPKGIRIKEKLKLTDIF